MTFEESKSKPHENRRRAAQPADAALIGLGDIQHIHKNPQGCDQTANSEHDMSHQDKFIHKKKSAPAESTVFRPSAMN
jgi:hypothetical protein